MPSCSDTSIHQWRKELLHHRDRSRQYTGLAYQAVLAQFQSQASMSGKDDCYDKRHRMLRSISGTPQDDFTRMR